MGLKAGLRGVYGQLLCVWLVMALLPAGVTAQASPEASPSATPVGTPIASPVTGMPQYPDLVAQPPNDLYFSTELLDDGEMHVLLRFSTVTLNVGEGPLELHGDPLGVDQAVTQNIYDRAVGGTVVERHELGLDLIRHPQHHHFHLDNFAAYELYRDDGGTLEPTGQGGKQSSCLLDSTRIDVSRGPDTGQYAQCELERQGISVGWGDRYSASLPDQWVDVGDSPLADGEYVLRYTVDPQGQLAEGGRTGNNVAETRFTVENGALVGRPEPPRCALAGPDHGPPGTLITMTCSHFPADSRVLVYWGEWDPWLVDAVPLGNFRSRGEGEQQFSFPLPEVEPGGYMFSAVAWDASSATYVSATLIIGVDPAPEATPGASPVAATPGASPVAATSHTG